MGFFMCAHMPILSDPSFTLMYVVLRKRLIHSDLNGDYLRVVRFRFSYLFFSAISKFSLSSMYYPL